MSTQTYFRQDIKPAILRHLQQAQDSVYIAMYCFNDKELYNQLLLLAHRGVKIKIVLDKQQYAQQNLDFSALIQADNAEVYFSETTLHHKFCIIDQKTVITGSANWTNAAFRQGGNFENVVIAENTPEMSKVYISEYLKLTNAQLENSHFQSIIDDIKRRSKTLQEDIKKYTDTLIDSFSNHQIPQIELTTSIVKNFEWLQHIYKQDFSLATSLWIHSISGKGKKYDADYYCSPNSDGLLRVSKNNKYGFIDVYGQEIIPCIYDRASQEFSYCCDLICVQKNEKYGYIDVKGKEVIPFIYDAAYDFNIGEFTEEMGLAGVKKGTKWGFIDGSGKEVLPFIYDSIGSHFWGKFMRVKKGGKYGFIDRSGREAVPCIYGEAEDWLMRGMVRVMTINGKVGYVNEKGEEIAVGIYDAVQKNVPSDKLVFVEKGGKYGFMDTTGKVIIPLVYDLVGEFRNGFAVVNKGEKWGLVDTKGKVIIPLVYDYVSDIEYGFALVKKGEKWGCVDITGKVIISFVYDNVCSVSGDGIEDGFVAVQKGEKWGVIDMNGKEIIPLIYDRAVDSDKYYDWSFHKKDGKWGLLDRYGNFYPF